MTLKKLLGFAIVIAGAAGFAIGCAGKKNKEVRTTYTMIAGECYANSGQKVDSRSNCGYFMANGYCYNNLGQSVAVTYCTSTGYYMNNGMCLNVNGVQVNATNCSTGVPNAGYFTNNGVCYNSQGTAVASTYCTNSNTNNQCVGNYYYLGQVVNCGTHNSYCRGYTLISVATNQSQYCQ
ncbi:MAG: hypothetical protein AB7H97_10960 [Pseudobdellovibrionaceae bacterium]